MSRRAAFRGRIVHCRRDPGTGRPVSGAIEHLEDGLLLVDDGRVTGLGPAVQMLDNLSEDYLVTHCKDCWIIPGFIDCHVHYPQLDMVASYGTTLLEWLETYTYPAEAAFADAAHAQAVADRFVTHMLAAGTTSAMVFATVHPESVDAIFEAALARDLRLWSGKVLMDRNCPETLRDHDDAGLAASRELIRRWHGRGRLQYALTPRFAPVCSEAQLGGAGLIARDHPDVYVHTHLAESRAEMDWVAHLFPQRRGYVDVYRHFGLLRERAVFAHCLHLADEEVAALAGAGSAIAFCPSSNLFLGSGLFDLAGAEKAGVRVGLGSDVGGGTCLSQLATTGDAYKTLQLKGQTLTPAKALYLATLGAARALYADDVIGNFETGKEADFVVLDPAREPLLERRGVEDRGFDDALFALMMLGRERVVRQTYVLGRPMLPDAG